jgi:hypothetical protein
MKESDRSHSVIGPSRSGKLHPSLFDQEELAEARESRIRVKT